MFNYQVWAMIVSQEIYIHDIIVDVDVHHFLIYIHT